MEIVRQEMRTRSVLMPVLAAVVLMLLLRVILLDVVRVQGHSMEPTLHPGEVLFVSRWTYGLQTPFFNDYLMLWHQPRRGDLVVFQNPLDGVLVVKRCVALEGDRIRVENNTMHIGKTTVQLTKSEARRFERYVSVPPGTVFVLGDNRAISEDSREYGFVPISRLIGRVIFRLPENER